MAMTFPYCNTTSDLQEAYKDIENFSGKDTLTTFTATSGQDKTFEKHNTGYVGVVYEDGVILTEKTSIATVQATASTYWYDSTNDILYVHCSDDADPDTHTIQTAAEDWATFKTTMVNRACQQLENLLDPVYPRPLPFAKSQYNSKNYDSDIVYCTALLACINIMRHRDPENSDIKALQDLVWNAEDERGILWEYRKGLRSFSFEATKDQFNGNIQQTVQGDGSTGTIHLVGTGSRAAMRQVLIVIVTGGAVKTATWKYSTDGGTTYSSAIATDYGYIYLIDNIWMRFRGTFVADDAWQVDIIGDESVTNANIKAIQFRR